MFLFYFAYHHVYTRGGHEKGHVIEGNEGVEKLAKKSAMVGQSLFNMFVSQLDKKKV